MFLSNSFKTYAFYALTFTGHLLPVSGSIPNPRGPAGCTTPHTVDGVSRDFQVATNGGNRTYRIHVPINYKPNITAPLIISYHGHGKDMVQQEILSQFSNDAINPNMIAVYPQGLKSRVSRALLSFPTCSSYHHLLGTYLSSVADRLSRAASDPGKENLTQRLALKTSSLQPT